MPLLVASDLKFSDLLRVSSKHLSRKLIALNACFVLFCPAVRSCSTSLSLVTVIHREGVGVKRKQKQRKTKKLGWLCGAGPDSGKKRSPALCCVPRVRLRGGTHLGVLVLSRSRSQCECLRVCPSPPVMFRATRFRRSGVRQ